MIDQLDYAVAVKLSRQLKSIRGFPTWDDEVIIGTAQDLRRWCKSAVIGQELWSAEQQAEWLVTEARENWDTWLGTKELKSLFERKFVHVVSTNNFIDYGSMPCICGSGAKFKSCCQGKPLFGDSIDELREKLKHEKPKGSIQ